MEEESIPLSDALKSFVRLDNRHFKQELTQSNRLGHKRTAGLGDGSQSKRLQRSASMDSLATNHASLGDFDDDMRDAPFDTDSMFGVATPDMMMMAGAAPQDESIPDLVEFPAPPVTVTPVRPSYASVLEMDSGVSPALAQVSLQDARNSGNGGGSKAPEMQERPNTLFFTRSNSAGVVNGGTVKGVGTIVEEDEEEPLIDLSDPHDPTPGSRAKVNGA